MPGLPPRAQPQQQDDAKENQHRSPVTGGEGRGILVNQEREAQRSRPTSAQYLRPGTAGRDRDAGGGGARVPAPWEVPQGRASGLTLNDMLFGGGGPPQRTDSAHKVLPREQESPHKAAALAQSRVHEAAQAPAAGETEAERAASSSSSAALRLNFDQQRVKSTSSSSEASRAPTAERVELGATSSGGKGVPAERPSSAIKRLPDARPSTAGRRRFSDLDSPALDGWSSSAAGGMAARDSLQRGGAVDNPLAPGLSSPAQALDRELRSPGWAASAMSATSTASAHSSSHHQHQHQHQQAEARGQGLSQAAKIPQPQARTESAPATQERAARDHGDAPHKREPTSNNKDEPRSHVPLAPSAGLGPMVKSADVQARPGKEVGQEQLQALVRSITAAHLKGLQQPFSSSDFYTLGKTLGEGAYGKVKLAVHRVTVIFGGTRACEAGSCVCDFPGASGLSGKC